MSRKIEEEKPDNDLETGPRLDSSKIVWTLKLKHFREVDENYGKYEEQERLKVQRRKVAALSKVEDSDNMLVSWKKEHQKLRNLYVKC